MIIVPLSAVPSQIVNTTVASQNCKIAVYTLGSSNSLYFDLSIKGKAIINCALCHDRVKLVQLSYLGLIGDFCFVDTQGTQDPIYTGIGSRYLLAYLP